MHCDANASHYLKVMLDGVFDPSLFRNEVVWKRTTAHSDHAQGSRHFGRVHDVLLLYGNGATPKWNPQYTSHSDAYVESKYRYVDPSSGRRYRLDNLTGPGGASKGNPEYEVMGVTRHWRYSQERMAMSDVYSYYDDETAREAAGPPVAAKRRANLSSHLPVRFSPEVLAAARSLAADDGLSISSWVRWLVQREVMRRTPATTESSTREWTFVGPPAETRTLIDAVG